MRVPRVLGGLSLLVLALLLRLSSTAEDVSLVPGGVVAAEAPPPHLVGVSQIGAVITAYLRPGGTETVASLTWGENAAVQGWRFTEVRRAAGSQEVVGIRLESGPRSVWLPVMGAGALASASVAAATASTPPLPGLDIPVSKHGPLHDQLLHRSRLRPRLLRNRPGHAATDLDPFPSHLVLPRVPR